MKSLKSVDITRTVAWAVLLVAVVEWFPFFLQLMLNFFNMNLRELPAEDILLILAPILSPLVTVVLSILGWKRPVALKNAMSVLGLAALIAAAALNWLAFSAYYQYYGVFAPDLATVGAAGGMFGILGYITPLVKPFLYWTNACMFYVMVPFLFATATGGTGRLQFSHELNLGALAAALYMAFRPGSIVDAPIRFVFVALVAGTIWLLDTGGRKEGNDTVPAERKYVIDGDSIPKWSEEGLAIVLAISLINPAMSATGLLNTTWTWLFLVLSTGIVEVMIIKNIKVVSKVPGALVFAGLVVMQAIVIWADIDAGLLAVEPWLHGASLFLLGLLFPACIPMLSRKRANMYLTNPGRQFLFNLIAVVSFLLPVVIIATLPPLSTFAGMLIVGIGGGLSLLALFIADTKRA